ncbi:MAG: hypothetical protein WCF67_06705 [Chitinophagaceae bacterium]
MKFICVLFAVFTLCVAASGKENTYTGSTPADKPVRSFLGISGVDSIDFIRWNLVVQDDRYILDCRYGISKPNTNGFLDEKKVAFSGKLSKQGNYYQLQQGNRSFYMQEINRNLLHLLDNNKTLLIGNGGFSYALNNKNPLVSDQFNFPLKQQPKVSHMTFQGRTPCQELSKLLRKNKGDACIKMKWYVILYFDPATGKPDYYLQGGRQYKKESMEKGKWDITHGKDGRIIYRLDPEKKSAAVHLVKADDNILFFTDAEGNLLVGNEDFSYTLNRTVDR